MRSTVSSAIRREFPRELARTGIDFEAEGFERIAPEPTDPVAPDPTDPGHRGRDGNGDSDDSTLPRTGTNGLSAGLLVMAVLLGGGALLMNRRVGQP